jgi:hypothetical protein
VDRDDPPGGAGFHFDLGEALARVAKDPSATVVPRLKMPAFDDRPAPPSPAATPLASPPASPLASPTAGPSSAPASLATPVAPAPAPGVTPPPSPVPPSREETPAAEVASASSAGFVADAPPLVIRPALPDDPGPAEERAALVTGESLVAASPVAPVTAPAPVAEVAPAPVLAVAAPALPEAPAPAATVPASTAPTQVQPAVVAPVLAPTPVLQVPAREFHAEPPSPPAAAPRPVARRAPAKRRRIWPTALALLVVLAAAAAGAYVVGGRILFDEEWAEGLEPVVADLELRAGLVFDDPVAVVATDPIEHRDAVGSALVGSAWVEEVPRWRALGLAEGEPTLATVGGVLAGARPVAYDPAADRIVHPAALTGAALDAALIEPLATALVLTNTADQAGTTATDETVERPAGLATDTDLVTAAIAAHHGRTVAAEVTGTEPARLDPSALVGLPTPLVHQLLATDRLGVPALTAAGINGVGGAAAAVLAVPQAVERLAEAVLPASGPVLPTGATADGTAAALGADAWFLVLAGRLPADVAGTTVDAIASDLLTPVRIGERACAVATFTVTDPAALPAVELAWVAWTLDGPAEADATVSVSPEGVVQVVSCDPGPAATTIVRPEAAGDLVARQEARLVAPAAVPGG